MTMSMPMPTNAHHLLHRYSAFTCSKTRCTPCSSGELSCVRVDDAAANHSVCVQHERRTPANARLHGALAPPSVCVVVRFVVIQWVSGSPTRWCMGRRHNQHTTQTTNVTSTAVLLVSLVALCCCCCCQVRHGRVWRVGLPRVPGPAREHAGPRGDVRRGWRKKEEKKEEAVEVSVSVPLSVLLC